MTPIPPSPMREMTRYGPTVRPASDNARSLSAASTRAASSGRGSSRKPVRSCATSDKTSARSASSPAHARSMNAARSPEGSSSADLKMVSICFQRSASIGGRGRLKSNARVERR
ncbi:MAG TPA: hypothetical protein VN282_15345 [Pyrinomonadaceae bacterium]|nr:hypothetical protein [Pyrinomonadaceae bacterium]